MVAGIDEAIRRLTQQPEPVGRPAREREEETMPKRDCQNPEFWCCVCDAAVYTVTESQKHTALGHGVIGIPEGLRTELAVRDQAEKALARLTTAIRAFLDALGELEAIDDGPKMTRLLHTRAALLDALKSADASHG